MNKYTINLFYEKYTDREILFNKNIQESIFLEPKKVFLKIGEDNWNCILYTCSMKNAKVIINLNKDLFEKLRKSHNNVIIKFSFNPPDEKKSVVFNVSAKVQSYKNYDQDDLNTYMVILSFIQKPSDFLIETLGQIIDQNEKIEKRKEIRIDLNEENLKKLGIKTNNITSVIDNIKRVSLLRNISASGAVILLSGIPKYLINKKIILMLKIKNAKFNLEGIINRFSKFIEKKALHEFGIQFEKEHIPLEFIKILNEYFDKHN